MTLSTTTSRVSYSGNGSTATFAFAFKIWAAANLKVYVRDNTTLVDTLQTLNTDYTVDVTTFPNAGNVVFAAPPASGRTVVIVRDMPLTQDLDLIASGAFAAENVETQLDKLAAEIQTLRELIARGPRFGVGSTLGELNLPEPRAAVANQLLGITSAGDGFDLKTPADLSLQTVSSYIATLLDDPDAATARATLGVGSAVDLNLLPTESGGIDASDFVPFVDGSESNASSKATGGVFFSTAINNLCATTTVQGANLAGHRAMVRKTSDTTLHKVLLSDVGAGRQTIWVPAGAMTPRTSNGAASGTLETATNKVMIKTLDFDAATWEYAQFSLQMPKSWNEGTFGAVFVWSHAPTATNYNVVWGIQGTAFSDNEQLDVSFGGTVTVLDTGGTVDRVYRSPEVTFTVAGPANESDLVIFQIQRAGGNVEDTLAIDARLHGIAVFYTTNANTDD